MMDMELESELADVVGPDMLCTDPEESKRRTSNTLGIELPILGIIYRSNPSRTYMGS